MDTNEVLLLLGAIPFAWLTGWLLAGVGGLLAKGSAKVTLTVAGWPLIPAAALAIAGIVGSILTIVS